MSDPIATHHRFSGAQAHPDAPADLLIEVAHGATTTADYRDLAALLQSPLPADLIDFFYVNTDVGAPELALAIAAQVIADDPRRTVLVLRAGIPRTFIDVNRVLDASPADLQAGKVTAALPPWITHPADRALLVERHAAYVAQVDAAMDEVARSGGQALFLHSYAPRTVDVSVGLNIVADLHAAYSDPARWPLRPPVDLIHRGLDGARYVTVDDEEALHAALAAEGIPLSGGDTYPMHPSTQAHRHAQRLPGRTLCVEVRRDLLADPWDPFAPMVISPAKVAPFARAFAAFYAARR